MVRGWQAAQRLTRPHKVGVGGWMCGPDLGAGQFTSRAQPPSSNTQLLAERGRQADCGLDSLGWWRQVCRKRQWVGIHTCGLVGGEEVTSGDQLRVPAVQQGVRASLGRKENLRLRRVSAARELGVREGEGKPWP